MHIKHSMTHGQSNMENCPFGGLSGSTEVPVKNVTNFSNGLRTGISHQEDKH